MTTVINGLEAEVGAMRTIVHERQGPATEVLSLREQADLPAPAAGEVLVRVLSGPIHPGDLMGIEGDPSSRPRLASPRSPGVEGMGLVEAAGAGVQNLRPGQRVAFFPVSGAWSELVTAPAGLVVPVPDGVSISTADDDWREQVRDATGGHGAQVVLDAVGGALTGDLVMLLADGGTLISYGGLGSGSTSLESLALIPRGLTMRGVSVAHWLTRTPAERAEAVAFAVTGAQSRPDLFQVAGTYDLADHAKAIAHTRRPGKRGTVLLTSPRRGHRAH